MIHKPGSIKIESLRDFRNFRAKGSPEAEPTDAAGECNLLEVLQNKNL
jgi:hypothetical protein